MSNITEFQTEWAELKAEWASLSPSEKQAQWDGFTDSVDEGRPGEHRFYGVLFEQWAYVGRLA